MKKLEKLSECGFMPLNKEQMYVVQGGTQRSQQNTQTATSGQGNPGASGDIQSEWNYDDGEHISTRVIFQY